MPYPQFVQDALIGLRLPLEKSNIWHPGGNHSHSEHHQLSGKVVVSTTSVVRGLIKNNHMLAADFLSGVIQRSGRGEFVIPIESGRILDGISMEEVNLGEPE